jgi:hypothetical protein
MNQLSLTAAMIEELVDAKCGDAASLRERHVFREALTGLVRLAKVEHALEMSSQAKISEIAAHAIAA